jgi:hypothetical protein
MHFDIPPEAFWSMMGVLIVTAGTALVWFLDWKGRVLTFSAHEKICMKRQEEVKGQFSSVVTMLTEQNTHSQDFRRSFDLKMDKVDYKIDIVAKDVEQLKTNVAVLQATRPATQVNVRGT